MLNSLVETEAMLAKPVEYAFQILTTFPMIRYFSLVY